ncbi:MAG: hypothetical protein MRY81_21690 [Donghicola eburneus]|nr:hypothetical protein [Donghicola eburneus]MCI5042273.1 hypothetical protein [Donghicola eburneus]
MSKHREAGQLLEDIFRKVFPPNATYELMAEMVDGELPARDTVIQASTVASWFKGNAKPSKARREAFYRIVAAADPAETEAPDRDAFEAALEFLYASADQRAGQPVPALARSYLESPNPDPMSERIPVAVHR